MLGRTNSGGGGGGAGGLNFQVIGGTIAPSNPKENTIWVNTSAPITSYILSATESSSAEEGMVWITTGKESVSAFNALKKNCLMVYPLFAKQYVSGAWVQVDAKIYQNGWNDLLTEVVFFGDGAINTDTFGNTKVATNFNNYSITGGNIVFSQYVDVTTTKMFDVTAFKTIEFVIAVWDWMNVEAYLVGSSGTQNKLTYVDSFPTGSQANAGDTRTFDISGYSGEYYLRLYTGPGGGYVAYSSIKFKA